MGGRGRWILEFEANLVYRSTRTSRVTQRNVLEKPKINKLPIIIRTTSHIKITTLLAFISKTKWAINFNEKY